MDAEKRELAQRIIAYAQGKTPVRTGRLKKSYWMGTTVERGRPVLKIGNSAPYAPYVENGTRRRKGRGMLNYAIKRAQRERPGLIVERWKRGLGVTIHD